MKKIKIGYTVFVDNKLWTNVVDDMNSQESWGKGGILFINKKAVNDFIRNLKSYDEWKNSEFEIINLYYLVN